MTLLTKIGLERPKAHEKLRVLSSSARAEGANLLDVVREDEELSGFLKAEKLDLEEYFNSIREVSRRIVKEAQKKE